MVDSNTSGCAKTNMVDSKTTKVASKKDG